MSVETLVEVYKELSAVDKERFFELIESDERVNDLSPEWIEEIDHRWQAFEKGDMEALDSEEADQRIIAEYGIQL